MRVVIRLFAVARQRVGAPEITVDLPDPATVADLRGAVADQATALAPLIGSMMVAVDGTYAEDEQPIRPGVEIALIPPVSGGIG